MTSLDVKGDLHTYLRGARETLVWKLDGSVGRLPGRVEEAARVAGGV